MWQSIGLSSGGVSQLIHGVGMTNHAGIGYQAGHFIRITAYPVPNDLALTSSGMLCGARLVS
jgi:hypothetical protein